MSENKISRLIQQYDLTGVESSLVRYWTHESDQQRKSVRELTSWFNQELMKIVLDEYTGGMIPSEYTTEEITVRLQAHDSTASKYREIPNREITDVLQWLRENDVPVDELIDDFVSYGTMYTYLREVMEVSPPKSNQNQRSPEERQADVLEGIRRDLTKQSERINNRLRTLRNSTQLPDTKPDIHVSAECNCPGCGYAQSIDNFIREQGCTKCEMHTRNK
jgi:hypothetical protein